MAAEKDEVFGDPLSQSATSGNAQWANDLRRKRQPGPAMTNTVTGLTRGARGKFRDATLAVHAGSVIDEQTGAVGTPIYQNSTFILQEDQYRSVDQGYARDRLIYTRYGNPSQWSLQNKLAALEGAESAIVFSSGMAAISASVLALMDKGAHLVASNELYGGTYQLFNGELPSMNMSASFVDPLDIVAIEQAIRPETQLLYFEALTNPLLKLVDVKALAALAAKYQLRLIVDATFITPIGIKPLSLGADLVVHSGSKYLNGHSDLIAGCAMGSRKLIDMIWPRLLSFGGSLDPHAAFLFERGLKTLSIRMVAHQQNAHKLAKFLESHSKIKRVIYPLLASYPQHELAKKQLNNGSGMVTFEVNGGDPAALKFLELLHLPKKATSLGGVESLISLPFNTSQAGFTEKQRQAMGINPGCVRLSVGIEDIGDLIADFDQALAKLVVEETEIANEK